MPDEGPWRAETSTDVLMSNLMYAFANQNDTVKNSRATKRTSLHLTVVQNVLLSEFKIYTRTGTTLVSALAWLPPSDLRKGRLSLIHITLQLALLSIDSEKHHTGSEVVRS